MNVVKVMGGLGNQLFQYALSRHLAQYDEIGYDITYYDTEENKKGLVFLHRDYLLPCFVDDLKIVNDFDNLEKKSTSGNMTTTGSIKIAGFGVTGKGLVTSMIPGWIFT